MGKKIFGIVGLVLLLVYFISLVLHISTNFDQYQWDFRTHRKAGEIFASNLDPYDSSILFPQAQTNFLYNYPPVTLYFYQFFAEFEYKTAFHIFLIAKCILLIGLIYFWKREFLKTNTYALFALFCLLAFNSAVYRDLIAGNINLLEQVFLWLAFFFYIKHRLVLFCAFCLLAASFKMTPSFFLVLLLLADDKKKYQYFVGAGFAFLAYLFIQFIIVPDMVTSAFQNAFAVVSERGAIVPSTFTLISDVSNWLAKNAGLATPPAIPFFILAVIVIAVILLSYKAHARLKSVKVENREMLEVFLVCLVYALIHPRFKDYAYILLIVPAYYIIMHNHFTKVNPFVFFFAILVYPPFIIPGTEVIFIFFWKYYPIVVAYLIWAMYLSEIFSSDFAKSPTARPMAK
jgi:Glycosyltransferase family 87